MNVFIFTPLLVLLLFYIGNIPVDQYNITSERTIVRDTNKLFFILGTLLLVYVSGQRYAYGDTVTYMHFFENVMPFNQCLSTFKIGEEWLFKLYLSFLHTYVSSNPRVFIEITSFLTIFPLMYFLYNYSGDLKFAFYIFVTFGCWGHSLNALRQYLVTSIIVACFPLIAKRRWYIFFPLIFVVAQIHTSAYIWFVLYFFLYAEAWGKMTKLIIILLLITVVASPFTGGFIDNLISDTVYGVKYVNDDWNYSINIFRVLVAAVPIAISYINRDLMKKKYKYYDIVFNMSLFFLMFTTAGIFSAVYARFNLYFEIFAVTLLVWNINEMVHIEKYHWVKIASYALFTIYFLYQMLFAYGLNWHERSLFFVNSWSEESWI